VNLLHRRAASGTLRGNTLLAQIRSPAFLRCDLRNPVWPPDGYR
jgi:hypothetical protein